MFEFFRNDIFLSPQVSMTNEVTPVGTWGKIRLDKNIVVGLAVRISNRAEGLNGLDETLEKLWLGTRSFERRTAVLCHTDADLVKWKDSFDAASGYAFAFHALETGFDVFLKPSSVPRRKIVIEELKKTLGCHASVETCMHFRGRLVVFGDKSRSSRFCGRPSSVPVLSDLRDGL